MIVWHAVPRASPAKRILSRFWLQRTTVLFAEYEEFGVEGENDRLQPIRDSLITQADYRNVVILRESLTDSTPRLDRPHSEISL